MEIFKSEEEFEPIDGTIVKYEIIEIGETNFQQEFINENNISNSFSSNIKQDEYTTTKFAEVYLDSTQDCLKYICLRCKSSELSIDNIINHFKEFNNTCENIHIKNQQENFNDEKKLGVFLVGNDFSISYSCSCCNLTLYNRSYIYPHLHQHLNIFKKSMINQKKRIANVYLLDNSTYSFLYSCNTCNQTFQSLDEHLQINSETCGNPLLNIKNEIEKDDELNAKQSKLCEIFMNTQKKISFMCLYCFEHHTDISSLSDHLLFHLHNKETQVDNKEKIIENAIEPSFKDALLAIESAAPEKKIVRNNNIKSVENILDSKEKKQKTIKIYKCGKCKNTMASEETLYVHWRSFHSKASKVNLNKEPEIPYVQQFLKHLSRSEKLEVVQSENSSGEEESNPIKLLDFCTSLPNLLPNIFNTSNNINSTIKLPDDSTILRNEKQIENVQNTITNSPKSLLKTTVKEKNKNINKINSKIKSNKTENKQVDIGIKHRTKVPENQTSIKDGLDFVEEYFEVLGNNNMDNDEESISQEKSNNSILSSPKYKCNLCARELRYKWYLHDHLFRIHGIKKLTPLIKRRRRKI